MTGQTSGGMNYPPSVRPSLLLAMDLLLAMMALAIFLIAANQKAMWREALVGTSLAGALTITLFRLTWTRSPWPVPGVRAWVIYALAAFLLLGAISVPRLTVIDAGSQDGVPYQLPGPLDAWSEGMAKEITVTTGGARGALVRLLLHESHDVHPPELLVIGGGCEVARIQVKKGNAAAYPNWKAKGLASEYSALIPAPCFSPANDTVIFRPIAGSWIVINRVEIYELPHPWELWRQVAEPWNWILFWVSLGLIGLEAALGWPREKARRRLFFGAAMALIVALAIVAALAGMAVYVEIHYRWMVKRGGDIRSKEMFYGSKFIRDAELGWRLLPGFVGKTLSAGDATPEAFYVVNNHGFRALAQEMDFPPKGKAIILGDSFAQGVFLAQDETIPAVMAEKLGGYVFNLGVGGFSTDQEYSAFIKWVDKLEASDVALFFYANDVLYTNEKMGHRFHKPRYETVDGKVDFSRLDKLPDSLVEEANAKVFESLELEKTFCCLTRRSAYASERIARKAGEYVMDLYYPGRLIATIVEDIARAKAEPAPDHLDVTADLLANPGRRAVEMDIVVQFLAKINQECERRGKRFILVFVPDILQIYGQDKPELSNFRHEFIKACAARGLRVLDPSDELVAKNKWNDTYFFDDGHFSPYGARIMGELIAGEMLKGK